VRVEDDSPRKAAVEEKSAGPLPKSAVVNGMNAVKPKISECYQQFKVPGVINVKVTSPDLGGTDKAINLALGPAAGEVWMGIRGSDLDPAGGQLHRSTDGGKTWTAIPGRHPHFRCLEHTGRALWGCGNNLEANGDTFAVGVSTDGGATWTRKFAFGDLCQSMPCVSSICDPILESLCVPGICANALEAPDQEPSATEPTDAGSPDAGTPTDDSSGCCRLGGPPTGDVLTLLLAALLLTGVRRRR